MTYKWHFNEKIWILLWWETNKNWHFCKCDSFLILPISWKSTDSGLNIRSNTRKAVLSIIYPLVMQKISHIDLIMNHPLLHVLIKRKIRGFRMVPIKVWKGFCLLGEFNSKAAMEKPRGDWLGETAFWVWIQVVSCFCTFAVVMGWP